MNEIAIFKQVAARWLNQQAKDLLGDGFVGKLLRPVLAEAIEKYSADPSVDVFLNIFVRDGKFSIDTLLDKYIEMFTKDGGIQFQWGDIAPMGSMLDKINGNRTNVITAADIKALKDNFLAEVKKQTV